MEKSPSHIKKEAEAPPIQVNAYIHESIVERLAIYENLAAYQEVKDYLFGKYGYLFSPPPELLVSPRASMVVTN